VELKFLTADAILEANDAMQSKPVDVLPSGAATVNVRAMNAHERGQFVAATVLNKTEGTRNMGEAMKHSLVDAVCRVTRIRRPPVHRPTKSNASSSRTRRRCIASPKCGLALVRPHRRRSNRSVKKP
jgi:hypothetical protein